LFRSTRSSARLRLLVAAPAQVGALLRTLRYQRAPPVSPVLQLVVSMLSKVMKDYEPGLIEFIESVWQQARSSPP
jgi:hypothetical protein